MVIHPIPIMDPIGDGTLKIAAHLRVVQPIVHIFASSLKNSLINVLWGVPLYLEVNRSLT